MESLATKCRTCMNQLFNFYQLYDYIDENLRIVEMIDVVVPQIHIKEENQFSHLICQMCVDKLLTGYKFQRLCIETDNHLRRQLGVAPLPTYNMKIDPLETSGCQMVTTMPNNMQVGSHEVANDCSKKALKFPCSDCSKVFECMSRLKAHRTLHRKKRTEKTYKARKQKPTVGESENEKEVGKEADVETENIEVTPQIFEKPIDDFLNKVPEASSQDHSKDLSNEKPTSRKASSRSPTKKRCRKEESWKKNILKNARNFGKAYVSHTPEKKVRSERKVKPPCLESCKLQCTTKLNEEDRQKIFSNFWNLGNLEKQRQYIANNTEPVQPKYRYVRGDGSRKPRIMNNAFYFRLGEKKIRVCKLFFKNTLDINDRNICTVLEKKHKVADTILEEDKRGKHGNHVRLDESIRDGVRNYINAILKTDSQRPNTSKSKHVLDGSKSISGIYKEYVADCEIKNIGSTNYTLFYRIFKEEFNIVFLKKETKKEKKSEIAPTPNVTNKPQSVVEQSHVIIQKYEHQPAHNAAEKYDQNMIMNLLYNH